MVNIESENRHNFSPATHRLERALMKKTKAEEKKKKTVFCEFIARI